MPSIHPDQIGQGSDKERSGPRASDVNPNSAVDIEKLRESISWSETQLKPFVAKYYDAVQYFAGSRYGDKTEIQTTAVNMFHLAVEIWLRQLAAQTPRSLVLTRKPELKTGAFELEIATDYLLHEINFGDSLSDCVRMAIFTMGIMKVGITSKYLVDANYTSSAGQPYADPVLFEDWIHDMTARRKEEWDYCGNRYKLPYDLVMENPDFDKKVLRKLKPIAETGGDPLNNSYEDETSNLSSSRTMMQEGYIDRIELIDLWLPGQNLYITIPAQEGLGVLQSREWEGPDKGPYHILGFSRVPGNIIPSAPAQSIYDLQDLITKIFNHIAGQATRQKTILAIDGRAESDGTGNRVMDSRDGQVIVCNHVDGIKEISMGGVSQESQGFLMWAKEMFSYLGGNIDAMGGLATQAGTLGQEELLVQSSSEMIRDMQAKVLKFTKEVVRDLAWYMYTDPFIELPLTKKIAGYGEVPFIYTSEDRQNDFFDYHFDIQPYSLQHKGPSQRLQTIMNFVQTVFLPLAPQLSEWGMVFNLQKLVDIISKYGDLPEIEDLISSEMPTPYEELELQQRGGGSSSERPLQSPATSRTYTRKNVASGGTQKGQDAKLMQSLMSRSKQGGSSGQ